MNAVHQLDTWLSMAPVVDSNEFYKSLGCTSEQLVRYLNLCQFFHVPVWYMQELHLQNNVLYVVDQFSDDPAPNLLGLGFADNHVDNIKSVIDFVESVPTIFFNTIVMSEQDKQVFGKHFIMAETCTVESESYESYLQKFNSKKRNGFTRANTLRLSPEFVIGTKVYDISYDTKTLEDYLADSEFCSVIERLLIQTSRKWFAPNIYHAQSSLLWALSIGGALVCNNSTLGDAGQFLVKRKAHWHNGFFTCTSKNPLYLKAFLLECLSHTVWSDGNPYLTTSHSTALDIFDADDYPYSAYKSQIADTKRPCGLIASVQSLAEKPDYLTPPYYVLDTKTWVFD